MTPEEYREYLQIVVTINAFIYIGGAGLCLYWIKIVETLRSRLFFIFVFIVVAGMIYIRFDAATHFMDYAIRIRVPVVNTIFNSIMLAACAVLSVRYRHERLRNRVTDEVKASTSQTFEEIRRSIEKL